MTRGRGDAPLQFGDPSPELREKLKTDFLPRGRTGRPEESDLYGLSATEPRADPQASPQGAAVPAGETDSGQAFRRSWTAGQRQTVRNYFKEK